MANSTYIHLATTHTQKATYTLLQQPTTTGKSHIDRAKEAEEAFKARRAAALAKSRVAR